MKKNAIHRRIDELTTVWNDFIDHESSRLFIFLLDGNNDDLVEAFISYHQEENSGLADLFLRFDKPFEQKDGYGESLKTALAEIYQNQEFQKLMQADGLKSEWAPPQERPSTEDQAVFGLCCRSLYEYHQEDMDNLVLVLTPTSIYSKKEWSNWVFRLLQIKYPPGIRFIVLDNVDSPALKTVAQELSQKVYLHRPAFDMAKIMEELAADGDPNDPGTQFRQCFMAIGKAASAKDLKQIDLQAKKGLEIVDKHEWFPLKASLLVTVAVAYAALSKNEKALEQYRLARQAANQAKERGDIEGKQLVIHTAMAEASALLSLNQHSEAAKIYDQCAAQVSTEPISNIEATNQQMRLENYRMASYCYASIKERENAWDRALQALQVGKEMEAKTREASTLPYVGQGLLQLAMKRPYREKRDWINKQMRSLLGKEWEKTIQA